MFRTLPLVMLVAACGPPTSQPVTRLDAPPDAVPGSCHARGVTPAVLETVTEQEMEAPEVRRTDGTLQDPARFRTVTSTRIVRARGEHWFEIPCAVRDGDPAFIAQIQRALAARAIYSGEINGAYDGPTRRAVRTFQEGRGLESGTLSLDAAQALGLVELGRDGV